MKTLTNLNGLLLFVLVSLSFQILSTLNLSAQNDTCCVYTASYWFNDGIAIDPITGLQTNQVYEITINGQVQPLNYPYGFGGNTNTDLINDLAALGFNAWFEYYTPPNSFTSQTIFYLDATNGDVLDDYLVYDVGVTLDNDLSCCPPIEPDPCCVYTASYWFNDGIAIDPITGLQTNQVYEIIINGQVQPLNYPYGFGGNTNTDLINDLAALGFNAWFEYYTPPNSFTSQTIFYLDATNGDVLDDYLVYDVGVALDSNLSCCPPIEPDPCCVYTASYWFNDGIAIDPITGLQTNQVYEITINGQVQPLNYPYGFGGNTNTDLINDLAALGFNAWFEYYTPPNSFTSQTIFYLDATNGDILDDYLVYDVGVTLDSDLSCCPPIEPDPCCVYTASYWFNDGIAIDPITGLQTNQVYEITINGQVQPLNYPYGFGGNTNTDLINDLAALGFNAWFEYYTPPNSFTSQTIFYLDATNGDVLDNYLVYDVGVALDSDLSCCPPTDPIYPCCAYIASLWLNDGISCDSLTGLCTNDIYEVIINGQIAPLPNYPYNLDSGADMNQLLDDLAALGYYATLYTQNPSPFSYETVILFDPSNGDTLDAINIYDAGSSVTSDLSCCGTTPPAFYCCKYDITLTHYGDDMMADLNGNVTGDIQEIYVDGQLLPLNYQYNFNDVNEMDLLVADMAALGYTITYVTNSNFFYQQTVITFEADNGNVVDSVTVFDADVSVTNDLSCCPIINPVDSCCSYTMSFVEIPINVVDPNTGYGSNDIYEIFVNGLLLPLNYPYSASAGLDALIDDLAALGYTATYQTYQSQNNDTVVIINFDADDGNLMVNGMSVFAVQNVSISHDDSCCTYTPYNSCCSYSASYLFNDGLIVDPSTGLTTNDIYEITINGQVLPLNYPYGSYGTGLDQLIIDLAALGYSASYDIENPAGATYSIIHFYLDASNGDVLDGFEAFDVGAIIIDSDLSCCPPIDPPIDTCCAVIASMWFSDALIYDPNTGLTTNDIYGLTVNGYTLPLNYPYSFGNTTHMDQLMADLAALGYNATYEVITPPQPSLTFEVQITFDVSNGDTLDAVSIFDGNATLHHDYSCCDDPPLLPIDTCCAYIAEMWFNDAISFDPVTGHQTNDIIEIVINGQVVPLNYPYNLGGGMNDLVDDLAALDYNASFITYSEPGWYTYQIFLTIDATNGDTLDGVNLFGNNTANITGDLSCCLPPDPEPVDSCCAFIGSLWLNDAISYDPNTGLYTNDIFEVVVNGQVLPLNYPYNLDSGADLDELMDDLAAMGYNASWYTQNTSPFSYETIILFDASNGDTLDAINMYDAGSSVTSDLSCCTPPDPEPVDSCCAYIVEMWPNDAISWDPVTGYQTNDILEIVINGQVVPLPNYPYNIGGSLDGLIDDLAALGYTASYTTYSEPGWFTQQIILTLDASNGDTLDAINLFGGYSPTIFSDFSCCVLPPDPIDSCCAYIAEMWFDDGIAIDINTGHQTNDILQVIINGQVVPLPNYPYNLGGGMDALVDDLETLGYNASYTTYSEPGWFTYQVFLTLDASNGDTLDTVNLFGNANATIEVDLSCCTPILPPIICDGLWLEGFYDGTDGNMQLPVNTPNLMPLSQPFNVAPWNYNGNESIGNIPTFIRDWVLVTIRDENGVILEEKACLLSIDGGLYDTDFTSGLEFSNIPQGNFIISVHHKSHLSIGKLINTPGIIDFTDLSNLLGNQQMKIIDNIPMLYSGDYDNNGIINNLDFNTWKPNNSTLNTYTTYDCDGNGITNNQDYNLWKVNKSKVGHSLIQY